MNCIVCGREFLAKSKNHVKCSDKCRKLWYKDYWRAYSGVPEKNFDNGIVIVYDPGEYPFKMGVFFPMIQVTYMLRDKVFTPGTIIVPHGEAYHTTKRFPRVEHIIVDTPKRQVFQCCQQ